MWPLAKEARGAQTTPSVGDDSAGAQKRAHAVISTCAADGPGPALQLLMSQGVAPADDRTLGEVREALQRHTERPLPDKEWADSHFAQAAAPENKSVW